MPRAPNQFVSGDARAAHPSLRAPAQGTHYFVFVLWCSAGHGRCCESHACVRMQQDFLRHTPEDHDDHANVHKALADMQQVAAYIEKKKEEAENIYHIMAIQDSLVGKFNVRVRCH